MAGGAVAHLDDVLALGLQGEVLIEGGHAVYLSHSDPQLLGGRSPRTEDSDCFSQAVAKYLTARRKVGSEWVYAFEKESAKARCLELYPQM